ncbi:MAG: DUF2933 domain-containing protein [Thermoplasmata archaeon]
MILCCLIPIIVLVVLWLIGISTEILIFAVILLCPIIHITMMLGMRKKSSHDENKCH